MHERPYHKLNILVVLCFGKNYKWAAWELIILVVTTNKDPCSYEAYLSTHVKLEGLFPVIIYI